MRALQIGEARFANARFKITEGFSSVDGAIELAAQTGEMEGNGAREIQGIAKLDRVFVHPLAIPSRGEFLPK